MSIEYVLIGNPEDCEEIGHYPDRGASKAIAKEANQIFKKLSESGIQTKDLRNTVDNRGKLFLIQKFFMDNFLLKLPLYLYYIQVK